MTALSQYGVQDCEEIRGIWGRGLPLSRLLVLVVTMT